MEDTGLGLPLWVSTGNRRHPQSVALQSCNCTSGLPSLCVGRPCRCYASPTSRCVATQVGVCLAVAVFSSGGGPILPPFFSGAAATSLAAFPLVLSKAAFFGCGCALVAGRAGCAIDASVFGHQWLCSDSVRLGASPAHDPGLRCLSLCNESVALSAWGSSLLPHGLPFLSSGDLILLC
jgi:hypothetical protein